LIHQAARQFGIAAQDLFVDLDRALARAIAARLEANRNLPAMQSALSRRLRRALKRFKPVRAPIAYLEAAPVYGASLNGPDPAVQRTISTAKTRHSRDKRH